MINVSLIANLEIINQEGNQTTRIFTEDQLFHELSNQMCNKDVEMVTVGHGGTQIRGWKGLWSHFSGFEGGHFDTSHHKVFDLNCKDAQMMERVLRRFLQGHRKDFVMLSAPQDCEIRCHLKTPLAIILPC